MSPGCLIRVASPLGGERADEHDLLGVEQPEPLEKFLEKLILGADLHRVRALRHQREQVSVQQRQRTDADCQQEYAFDEFKYGNDQEADVATFAFALHFWSALQRSHKDRGQSLSVRDFFRIFDASIVDQNVVPGTNSQTRWK